MANGRSIDSRLGYEVWLQLISDEKLYDALMAGTHHELEPDPARRAVLDELKLHQRGTRWNIENLRFRTADECANTIRSYMPRTAKLLSNGIFEWLHEICFEYLSSHRWKENGHFRFTECERFGEYVRHRIVKRRLTHPHLLAVLDFELGLCRVLKATGSVPASAWPAAPPDRERLPSLVVRRSPASAKIACEVDLRPWVESGDPSVGVIGPDPVTFLVYVPSLRETHRIKTLGEGAALAFDAFDGTATVDELASRLEDEGIERDQFLRLTWTWLTERVLWVA